MLTDLNNWPLINGSFSRLVTKFYQLPSFSLHYIDPDEGMFKDYLQAVDELIAKAFDPTTGGNQVDNQHLFKSNREFDDLRPAQTTLTTEHNIEGPNASSSRENKPFKNGFEKADAPPLVHKTHAQPIISKPNSSIVDRNIARRILQRRSARNFNSDKNREESSQFVLNTQEEIFSNQRPKQSSETLGDSTAASTSIPQNATLRYAESLGTMAAILQSNLPKPGNPSAVPFLPIPEQEVRDLSKTDWSTEPSIAKKSNDRREVASPSSLAPEQDFEKWLNYLEEVLEQEFARIYGAR